MKLKKGYILQKDGNDYILVADGNNESIDALIGYSNDTAYFILEQLSKSDGTMTEKDVVDIMLDIYEAPREIIEKDVHKFIEKLDECGLVE